MASIEVDDAALGRAAGDLGARVLKGETPERQVVVSDAFLKVSVDEAIAKRLGIDVPPGLGTVTRRVPPTPTAAPAA